MIEFTSYEDAVKFKEASNDKIKVVYFYKKDCPYCDDFIPHVFEKHLLEKSEHFDWRKVCVDTGGIPFPPRDTPLAYFWIPNTEEPMPLIRNGACTPQLMERDLNCMISIKDEGKSIEEAFFGDGEAPLSSWGQQFIRKFMNPFS